MKIKELESQVESLRREEADQINDKETIEVCNYCMNCSNGCTILSKSTKHARPFLMTFGSQGMSSEVTFSHPSTVLVSGKNYVEAFQNDVLTIQCS